MTTAWSHLPNAALIDRILADVRRRPDARGAARGAARDAAWAAAWAATWVATRAAGRDAARAATWGAAWGDARGDARGACAALIAWDDAAAFLDMPVAAVRLYAANGNHAAVLMLPACIALETTP